MSSLGSPQQTSFQLFQRQGGGGVFTLLLLPMPQGSHSVIIILHDPKGVGHNIGKCNKSFQSWDNQWCVHIISNT